MCVCVCARAQWEGIPQPRSAALEAGSDHEPGVLRNPSAHPGPLPPRPRWEVLSRPGRGRWDVGGSGGSLGDLVSGITTSSCVLGKVGLTCQVCTLWSIYSPGTRADVTFPGTTNKSQTGECSGMTCPALPGSHPHLTGSLVFPSQEPLGS